MAVHKITHGSTGDYIEQTNRDEAGALIDFTGATLQVEVCRVGQTGSIIIDATPTNPSTGVLRYTFVDDDWTTIPNRSETYWIKFWGTRGGVTSSYPHTGYDTLEVTADPQGVPADVGTVSYLTTALAAATYIPKEGTGKDVQINGSVEALRFHANVDRHMAVFYRYGVDIENTVGPQWLTGTIINSQGAYYSNSWITLSGHMHVTPDSDGVYLPQDPTSGPFMLGLYNDTEGPSIFSRANTTGTYGYHFQATSHDATPKYVFRINEDGKLRWGAGTTLDSEDTELYRTGAAALRTNATLTADVGLVAPSLTSQSGSALALTSRKTANSGLAGFTFTRENQGTDPLLDLINGGVTAVTIDGNATLNVLQGQAVAWAYKLGVITGQESYPGLWLGAAVPSLSNYSFLYDSGAGGTSIVNGPAAVAIRVNNSNQIRIGSSTMGFYGATPVAKPTISGSRGGNAALADLLTKLATLGLLTDSTS